MNYVLVVSDWRCGGIRKNALGCGETCLKNPEGYSCCLGQFAQQVGFDDLFYLVNPQQLARQLRAVYDPVFVYETDYGDYFATPLALRLMKINDNPSTTPLEKVISIREELEKAGHTLEVIDPENILGQ